MSEAMRDHEMDDLKKDLGKLKDDLGRLGADVKKVLEAKVAGAGKIGHTIGENMHEAWDGVQGSLREAKAWGAGAAEDVEGEIRKHPWRSVLTAAGVGIILGLLLSRRARE